MLRNYFRVAIRNLYKNKVFAVINIAGLGLGLACVFLIVQYLRFELSYDKFHEGSENIYRVAWFDDNPQPRTPHPMAQAMVQDFPEVESAVSLTPLFGFGLIRETFSIRNPERNVRFDERNVISVDTTFFKVFSFPLIKGDPKTVLKKPDGILISESMARKYFGDEDPVGKGLEVNDDKRLTEVIGVFKDVPAASHFHFDILTSYMLLKSLEGRDSKWFTWDDFGHYNYVRLKPGADPNALEAKMLDWVRKYLNVSDEVFRTAKMKGVRFELQPITDIHLKSHLLWELEPNGYISYVYMLTAAGFLILIIAAVNFINLTTAQSADRAREIGIRKSLGAYKQQLAMQFTGEALLISTMAVLLALVIVEAIMPLYTAVTGRSLEMNYVLLISALAGLGLLTGLLAGAFPSMHLASIKPTLILKGKLPQSPEGRSLRQAFITFQFFTSMALMSSSAVIYNQLQYIQDRPLGFDQEQVITLPIKNDDAINPRFDALRQELTSIPGVKMVSAAASIPGSSFNRNVVWNSLDPNVRAVTSEEWIDYDFFSLLGIEFAGGRAFERGNPADAESFIINETAARELFQGDAVGKELTWDYETGQIKGTVIGVVKDFNFQSLHDPIKPLLFRLQPRYNYVLVKMNTDHLDARMQSIREVWKKFDDRFDFEFRFLKDELNSQYSEERNMSQVLTAFSTLAIAIACFGLLGIAALTFRQKTKEVSIRKVMGATVSGITYLLLKDFTRMVLVAIVLAIPVTWWAMNQWLLNFTFRTQINPLIFVASGILLVLVAWGTISYLTLKVAKTNPAETLKAE